MNSAQRKALRDYAEEFGYSTKEIVQELKSNGMIDAHATADDLGDYTNGNTYDDMMNFLEVNL